MNRSNLFFSPSASVVHLSSLPSCVNEDKSPSIWLTTRKIFIKPKNQFIKTQNMRHPRLSKARKDGKKEFYKLKIRLIFMLEGLCGNKNVQKVLLFLFVNNKCYGAQLQRLLRTPLTSLQNALARLEKGRIIASYCEGKNKTIPIESLLSTSLS